MEKKAYVKLILVLGAIAALGPLSIDMYLPAFPQMAESFGVDSSKISWTLTSYFIGISVGQLIYGPIVDRYGRIPPLLIGLTLYSVAALGCALSEELWQIVLSRLFLAFGGSVGMVSARAMVRDLFSTKEVARVFSALILVMGLAPILAPTLGGFIVSSFDWQYIFYLLGLVGIALLILVYFGLSETTQPDPSVSIKFSYVSKQYLRTFRNPQFVVFGVAGSLAMAGLFAYISSSPVVLMENLGFDRNTYTLLFGSNALAFVVGSQLNRHILKKGDTLKVSQHSALVALGLSIFMLGYMYFHQNATWEVSVYFGSLLFCFGFVNPNTTALALEPFEKGAGMASALVGSMRMAASALVSGLVSYVVLYFFGIFWLLLAINLAIVLLVYAPAFITNLSLEIDSNPAQSIGDSKPKPSA